MQKNEDRYDETRLREANRYEDILDVFLNIVMLRMPTAFILINMTLMIWLVQTINSSFGTDSVPRSLYFATDDNDNSTADFIRFYSGEELASAVARRGFVDIKIDMSFGNPPQAVVVACRKP